MAGSFSAILREIAAATPDAPALTCDGATWTFAQLDGRVSQTAQALLDEGVRPGDRVAVLSRNCPSFFEMIFAANRVGAILVGLNWRLAPPELDAIVADARPFLIFVGERGEADLLSPVARATPGLQRTILFGAPFENWRDGASDTESHHAGAPDDVAMILYTSGTTGLPKGAMLTNRGMAYSQRLGREWGMSPASVNLVAMPLFHIGGSGYGSSTMLVGGHTVLMRDTDLPSIVRAIEAYRVTHAFFVPTVIRSLLDVPGIENANLSSLKLLMYGASPIDETLLRRALAVLQCEFIQAYGMTETSGTVVTLAPEEHRLDVAGQRLRACGLPLPFVEIRISDLNGIEAAAGDVGEIWIRSEMVMKGYWENVHATAQALTPDGWLRTGDAAYRDAAGYIYLYDRFKDMIISGGENIYPAEIENVLLSHPAIREAAVIGVPHDRWGETPRAIVVTHGDEPLTPEEIIDFTRSRLARYKCPTSVLFAEDLPRNASGKLLKRELRQRYGVDPAVPESAAR